MARLEEAEKGEARVLSYSIMICLYDIYTAFFSRCGNKPFFFINPQLMIHVSYLGVGTCLCIANRIGKDKLHTPNRVNTYLKQKQKLLIIQGEGMEERGGMGGYNCSGWSFEEPGNDAFGHLHTITLLRSSFSCRFLFFLLVFFLFGIGTGYTEKSI